MKKAKWNIGLLIIKAGYKVRKYNWPTEYNKRTFRWIVGRCVLKIGFFVRGDVPQKTYKWAEL